MSVGELEPRRIRAIGVRILAGLSMPDRRLIQKTLDAAALAPTWCGRLSAITAAKNFSPHWI